MQNKNKQTTSTQTSMKQLTTNQQLPKTSPKLKPTKSQNKQANKQQVNKPNQTHKVNAKPTINTTPQTGAINHK